MNSPKYHWKLKNPNSQKETSIRLRFYLNRVNIVYGTGLKIFPELWSYEYERTILSVNDKSIQNKERVKSLLDKYSIIIPHVKTYLENIDISIENIITNSNEYFSGIILGNKNFSKREYLSFIKEKEDKINKDVLELKEWTLYEYLDDTIKRMESNKILNPSNDKPYTKGTIKIYKLLKNKIEQFDLSLKKGQKEYVTKFNDIDLIWYRKFKEWISNKDYSRNYFGKLIQHLKAIMQRSLLDGLHDNREFKRPEFKKIQEKTHKIALTSQEVNAIFIHDLSHLSEGHSIARDLFVISCFTALRVSDFNRLTKDHIIEIEGVKFINIETKKGEVRVTIPIRKELEHILNKYDYAPPRLSEQKINQYIKVIAELAGITRNEEIDGEPIARSSLITNHTGRRTGATLMKLAGIPLEDIIKITGHSNVKILKTYIKTTTNEDAIALSKNQFFIGKPVLKTVN